MFVLFYSNLIIPALLL